MKLFYILCNIITFAIAMYLLVWKNNVGEAALFYACSVNFYIYAHEKEWSKK